MQKPQCCQLKCVCISTVGQAQRYLKCVLYFETVRVSLVTGNLVRQNLFIPKAPVHMNDLWFSTLKGTKSHGPDFEGK